MQSGNCGEASSSDPAANRIREVTLDGNIHEVIAGTGRRRRFAGWGGGSYVADCRADRRSCWMARAGLYFVEEQNPAAGWRGAAVVSRRMDI